MSKRPLVGKRPLHDDEVDLAAASWLIARDEGLNADQQREFERWLADPVHAAVWAEARGAWAGLDRLQEIPEAALVPESERAGNPLRHWWPIATVGLAAALVLGFALWPKAAPTVTLEPSLVRIEPKHQILPDGTRVDLNGNAEIAAMFTGAERRVRLVKGEALFSVTKDLARPFFVEASGVTVRVIGTSFSVTMDSERVDVLVTEGRVRVDSPTNASISVPAAVELNAGYRATITLASTASVVSLPVDPKEVDRSISWQVMRLQFQDMPLSAVAAEFNRYQKNGRRPRLVIDQSAADIPVAGNLRADNVEVFARFLEESFNLSLTRKDDGTIVVSK